MTQDFERYAEERIPKLRNQADALVAEAAAMTAEADALERALRAFRGGGLRVMALSNGTHISVAENKAGRQTQPGSQADKIMTLLTSAGEAGRSLQEMYGFLAEQGVTNTASVRSVIWGLKKAGRVTPHGDRYFITHCAPHRETATHEGRRD